MPAYWVSLPSVVSGFLGATQANLDKLFPVLGDGVALVLDELDAIGQRRGIGDHSGSTREGNAIVNSLLSLMDRQSGGMLIATTNRVDVLDEALVRRFDLVLEFPRPSSADLRALADILGERFSVDACDVESLSSFDEVTKAMHDRARARVLASGGA